MRRPILMALIWALICLALAPAASAKARPAAEATLGFGGAAPGRADLTDPRTGRRYRVELAVDRDVNGREGVVLLVLLRPGGGENLLTPFGVFHGLQPYHFAALDLVRGPDRSAYGRVRALPIRRTATRLAVRIVEAQTRPSPPTVPGETDNAELTKLRVHVSLESGR